MTSFGCDYPKCKCVVSTSTKSPTPVCPKGRMTPAAALDLALAVAERWAENREEMAFSDRVMPGWTDDKCAEFAKREGEPVTVDEVKEVRDLWRAIAVLRETQKEETP